MEIGAIKYLFPTISNQQKYLFIDIRQAIPLPKNFLDFNLSSITDMIKKIVIFFSCFILGCTNQNTNSDDSSEQDSNRLLVEGKNQSELDKGISEFKLFWDEFRKAVLESDSTKLIQMTHFPLKTHGDQDEDPQIDLTSDDFKKVFQIYLNRKTVYFNGTYERNLDYIKRTVEEEKNSNPALESWRRMGDMEFEKINGNWQLTLIYLDTNELKASKQ
jgi:hypothetical protein